MLLTETETETDGPVAELAVEADDEGLLVGGEVAALDVRAEVVDPAEAAALPAAEEAGLPGQRAPVGVAVLLDVGHQALVLLGAPRAPPQPLLLAARRPPHRTARASRRSLSKWLAGWRRESGKVLASIRPAATAAGRPGEWRSGEFGMEHDGDGLSRVPGVQGYLWREWGESEWDGRIAVAGADLENVRLLRCASEARCETRLRVCTLARLRFASTGTGGAQSSVCVCVRWLPGWARKRQRCALAAALDSCSSAELSRAASNVVPTSFSLWPCLLL